MRSKRSEPNTNEIEDEMQRWKEVLGEPSDEESTKELISYEKALLFIKEK